MDTQTPLPAQEQKRISETRIEEMKPMPESGPVWRLRLWNVPAGLMQWLHDFGFAPDNRAGAAAWTIVLDRRIAAHHWLIARLSPTIRSAGLVHSWHEVRSLAPVVKKIRVPDAASWLRRNDPVSRPQKPRQRQRPRGNA